MRHENYTDKTADVKIEKIMIPVGNQNEGGKLELVSLDELLKNPEQFMSTPMKGKIKTDSLFAKRDTHVLVSAQHAFLPVPKEGKATFWPVIFNYQSTKKNPAVLAILVTRQGTSMTIIDNNRDTVTGGDSWGQRLYFNQSGIARGLVSLEQYHAVRRRLDELLAAEGAVIADTFTCPHHPDFGSPCPCRKPGTALYERAAIVHELDLSRCLYIGDPSRDLAPAVTFGGRGALVQSRATSDEDVAFADATRMAVVPSLLEAVCKLLAPVS